MREDVNFDARSTDDNFQHNRLRPGRRVQASLAKGDSRGDRVDETGVMRAGEKIAN